MIKIIYLSTMCDELVYKQIIKIHGKGVSPQMQNYNYAFYRSLLGQNCNISLISILPYKFNYEEFIVTEKNESNIPKYMNYIQGKQIGKIRTIINTIRTINKIRKSANYPVIIICDSLNLSLSFASFYSRYFLKIKTLGIVTDYPITTLNKKITFIKKLYQSLLMFLLHRYSAYIVLTNFIGEKFKSEKIVLKGQIEINSNTDRILSQKKFEKDDNLIYRKKIILYSGSLTYENGVDLLLYAFGKLKFEHFELHIYGNGPLSDLVFKYAKNSPNIKFFGFTETESLRILQTKADLLINPRPSNQDFVKYSFPSKNLEYMSSGTPLLTTNLIGMNEFSDFIFFIEEESPEGIAKAIMQTFKSNNLVNNAIKARDFIIKNYSTESVGRRILGFIEERVLK